MNDIMNDTLIISDYDSGYTFTVLWRGKIYDEGTLYDICFHNEEFDTLRKELARIDIFPEVIIICSDGCIYVDKKGVQ